MRKSKFFGEAQFPTGELTVVGLSLYFAAIGLAPMCSGSGAKPIVLSTM